MSDIYSRIVDPASRKQLKDILDALGRESLALKTEREANAGEIERLRAVIDAQRDLITAYELTTERDSYDEGWAEDDPEFKAIVEAEQAVEAAERGRHERQDA